MAIVTAAFKAGSWMEKPRLDMDLIKIIGELRREKEKLDRIIASLEKLQAPAAVTVPEKKRRGRKSMSPEERREASERMKKYWADWRNKRRHRT